MNEVVIGIDLGTQGARVFAVQPDGRVTASANETLRTVSDTLPEGWCEQEPDAWWQSACACLRKVLATLPAGTRIAGVSVVSTSGTVVPVDALGKPLSRAVLYNDRRSEAQAAIVQQAGAELQKKFGYQFGSSFGLPKILWFQQVRPDVFNQARWFLHAADFLSGKLTGKWGVSDSSNALKTGYDLLDLCWPAWIEGELGIPLEQLPRVVLPGQPIGQVCLRAAEETGLPTGTPVYAGATDGTAAQFASGAMQPGDWNSTLGTTLVLKGISRTLRPDPLGRIYSHLHPEGWWMPGGASNTGTEWIQQEFLGREIEWLDRQAEPLVPTALVRYPLVKKGERFPFVHAGASGFTAGTPRSPAERYAAGIEGMGLVERLAYDTLQSIGLGVGEQVYITGGGTRSAFWSRIRASVLGKTLHQPEVAETAFGAAILAAAGAWYGSVSQAAQHMVKMRRVITPDPALHAAYQETYALFLSELGQRGYLE